MLELLIWSYLKVTASISKTLLEHGVRRGLDGGHHDRLVLYRLPRLQLGPGLQPRHLEDHITIMVKR